MPFRDPAIWASSTSRDGISPRRLTCAGGTALPSTSPAFTVGRSNSRAKSPRILAAARGSFVSTSPVGPARCSSSPVMPVAELGHAQDGHAGEVRHVDVRRVLEQRAQTGHRLLAFGLVHRYTAVSSRTPGPMVLEMVAVRM